MYAAIHVRFGREMNDGVRRFAAEQLINRLSVAYVGLREAVAWVFDDCPKILKIARIGQLVQIDDPLCPPLKQRHAHEARADETGPTRNQQLHLCCSSQS